MNVTAAMEKALEALDRAKSGLVWYADEHPESRDGSDDESTTEINEAISSLSEAIAAVEECKPVAGLLGTKVNFGAPDTRDIENGWEPLYLAAGAQPAHDELISDMLTKWKTGLVCGQDAMVLIFRHYSSNPSSTQPAPKQDERWCDVIGIGKPGVSCGDCPKDYAPVQGHKALSDRQIGEVIDEVARVSEYGHHHTGRWMEFARAIEAKIKEQS